MTRKIKSEIKHNLAPCRYVLQFLPHFRHDPCTLRNNVLALSEDAVSNISYTTLMLLSNRICGGIRRTFARCDGRQNRSRKRNKECTFSTPSRERARSQCEVTRMTRCPHRLGRTLAKNFVRWVSPSQFP